VAEEKSGLSCGTFLPIRGAASWCWTSSPPRMWGGESRPVENGAESETSEWELRERREREEERRVEAEELGAEVEEPLFLPTPAFMASAEEE
jgi:hypothetical protein